MANLLKVNVTVSDLCHVHSMAHHLKDLARHLKFDNSQIEITVDSEFGAVTPENIAALESSTATLKASSDELETAVRNASDHQT